MRVYSPFFFTVYDETGPVGPHRLGQGTHYSIFRAIVWEDNAPLFHDFACIWDEDHDERIVWVIEQLFVRDMLRQAVAIGERKGSVTVILKDQQPPFFESLVRRLSENVLGDAWAASVDTFPETGAIINAKETLVQAYLQGIVALWNLGTKPCEYYRENPSG